MAPRIVNSYHEVDDEVSTITMKIQVEDRPNHEAAQDIIKEILSLIQTQTPPPLLSVRSRLTTEKPERSIHQLYITITDVSRQSRFGNHSNVNPIGIPKKGVLHLIVTRD